jgi:rubrerythrin
VEISGAFPAGVIGDTKANLKAAADGEMHENTKMYPGFASVADSEGFSEIAETFRKISSVGNILWPRYVLLHYRDLYLCCSRYVYLWGSVREQHHNT